MKHSLQTIFSWLLWECEIKSSIKLPATLFAIKYWYISNERIAYSQNIVLSLFPSFLVNEKDFNYNFLFRNTIFSKQYVYLGISFAMNGNISVILSSLPLECHDILFVRLAIFNLSGIFLSFSQKYFDKRGLLETFYPRKFFQSNLRNQRI